MLENIKSKRRNKKGFTLVELIVVLVILAILAAILIPSMVGWIDKANEKTALVEGRTILMASQTIASEYYAVKKDATALPTDATSKLTPAKVIELAGIGGSFTTVPTIADGKVTGFVFKSLSGYDVTYNSTITEKFTIVKSK